MSNDRRFVGWAIGCALLLAACGGGASPPSTTLESGDVSSSSDLGPEPSTTLSESTTTLALAISTTSEPKQAVTTIGPAGGDPPPDAPIPPGMEGLAADARADLARMLGVAEADIAVVEAMFVVWPDASYGCPQPGTEYTQVQVDGALIVLLAAGAEYHYHKGGLDPIFHCA